MPTLSALNDKDQELIAVGASIAAGCVPCTQFHFRAARLAGANDEEIRQAANDALCVRRDATEIMSGIVGNPPNAAGDATSAGCDAKPLIGELVSAAAAYAVSCAAGLEKHIAAAQSQGATGHQILAALKIACAIKDVAGKKAQSAAAKALGAAEYRGEDYGCQSGPRPSEEQLVCGGEPVSARSRNRNECGCHSAT